MERATAEAPVILGIHHASLLVADLERALAFYQGVLGLRLDGGRPEMAFPGAWLGVGEQQIHLMELRAAASEPAASHGGRDRHIALQVVDLDRLRLRLEQAGISFTSSRSGRRALFCRDPDGNALEFAQSG